MTKAAELAANHLVGASLDRLEPQRNDLAGNGVLRDSHVRKSEIMDHVLGGELDDYRPVFRDMQFAQHEKVVLRRLIGRIEAKRVGIRDERNIATAKDAVRAGHVKVPVKLLPDGMHDDRILVVRK